MEVPRSRESASASREIASEESPVRSDARKAHIIILHELGEIARRLARLEERLGS